MPGISFDMRKVGMAGLWLGGAAATLAGLLATAGIALGAADRCTNLVIVSYCMIDGHRWQGDVAAPWSISNGPKGSDIRFEVRSGDRAKGDIVRGHPAERAEVSESKYPRPFDRDIWFSFGMMVEPGPKVSSDWVELGQLRPTLNPGDRSQSPPWAQGLAPGDEFRVQVRTLNQKPLRGYAPSIFLFKDPGFRRGRTYHFVYRLRYGIPDGRLEAWRDGVKIADYSGPLGFPGNIGPYFKFGIYREPAPETLAVHYYDIHFSDRPLRP
jgi:hypothetical protein